MTLESTGIRCGESALEESVSNNERIDALVATVRDLNHEIRPKLSDTPGGDPPGNDLHTSLAKLREHEHSYSRLIRMMTLSDVAATTVGDTFEFLDPNAVSSRRLLSEFGTAREAILSVLRTLDDEQWNVKRDTPDGQRSLVEVVDELIESDRSYVSNVVQSER
jgi:hypothetical protein